MEKSYLKFYTASFWGDDVSIIGTKSSLEKLRDLISEAIEGKSTGMIAYETDDKVYSVYCKTYTEAFLKSEDCPLPEHYSDGEEVNYTEEEQQILKELTMSIDCDEW